MSYEIRNSLVLASCAALIGLGGYFLIRAKFGQDFSRIEKEIKTRQQQLEQLQISLSELDIYEKQCQAAQEQLRYYPKVILPEQTIHQTYRYLEEIDRAGTFFNFRFKLQGIKRQNNVSTASYELSGEGDYAKVRHFIRRLEYGTPLYKIEALNLKRKPEKQLTEQPASGSLDITIRFDGIFFTQLEKPDLMAPSPYAGTPAPDSSDIYDPFTPLILAQLPPNTQNLPDLASCQLVALSARIAFIQDQNGKIRELRIGDRVYLGYLANINLKRGEARFELDRGGIPETVVLRIKPSTKGGK